MADKTTELDSMMTLYDYLPSQNAYKIRLLLNHLQLPYKTKLVSIFEGDGQADDYLTINPTGAVPALALADGRTIAESNAILTYLAEGTKYLPADNYQRTKVLQWLFFEADYVQSTVATLRHWVQTGKDKNYAKHLIDAKRAGSLKTLRILDHSLSLKQFLAGDSYSVADISNFAYVHLSEEANLRLQDYPNIERWIDDIRSQELFLDKIHPYSVDQYSVLELPS